MAYDDARGVLYISNGGRSLRYQPSSGTVLAPLLLNGTLGGMDISPDGQSLVVADNTYSGGQLWVYIVDLVTLAAQKISFPQAFSEGGTFTAAYGSDGSILISSKFLGSGFVPLSGATCLQPARQRPWRRSARTRCCAPARTIA